MFISNYENLKIEKKLFKKMTQEFISRIEKLNIIWDKRTEDLVKLKFGYLASSIILDYHVDYPHNKYHMETRLDEIYQTNPDLIEDFLLSIEDRIYIQSIYSKYFTNPIHINSLPNTLRSVANEMSAKLVKDIYYMSTNDRIAPLSEVLRRCAARGCVQAVRQLLTKRFTKNKLCHAMFAAVLYGHWDVVKILIDEIGIDYLQSLDQNYLILEFYNVGNYPPKWLYNILVQLIPDIKNVTELDLMTYVTPSIVTTATLISSPKKDICLCIILNNLLIAGRVDEFIKAQDEKSYNGFTFYNHSCINYDYNLISLGDSRLYKYVKGRNLDMIYDKLIQYNKLTALLKYHFRLPKQEQKKTLPFIFDSVKSISSNESRYWIIHKLIRAFPRLYKNFLKLSYHSEENAYQNLDEVIYLDYIKIIENEESKIGVLFPMIYFNSITYKECADIFSNDFPTQVYINAYRKFDLREECKIMAKINLNLQFLQII